MLLSRPASKTCIAKGCIQSGFSETVQPISPPFDQISIQVQCFQRRGACSSAVTGTLQRLDVPRADLKVQGFLRRHQD